MPKRIKAILLLCMIALFCCACGKAPLEPPEYPLSQENLDAALADVGVEWTVSRESSTKENHRFHTLNNSEDKMISNISTAKGDGDSRWLQIGFLTSPTAISVPLPEENWVQALELAQALYGGFDAKTQIRDMLEQANEDEFTIHEIQNAPVGPDCKKIQWRKKISDINCIITFLQFPDEEDRLALESILLYDSDEFMQQTPPGQKENQKNQ